MSAPLEWFRRYSLHFWALVIAVALWLQVHGKGDGSITLDVPLQVRDLPESMVIVNDLPGYVRVTVTGLQTRLKELNPKDLVVPINAADLTTPGVVERAPKIGAVSLPVGLHIDKVQPDRLELQVDRLVTRSIPVHPFFELPEDWQTSELLVRPKQVALTGPEVWLDTLQEVNTTPIRLDLKVGHFQVESGIESPSGKAIHLSKGQVKIIVSGRLMRRAVTPPPTAITEPIRPEEVQAAKHHPAAVTPTPAPPASAPTADQSVPAKTAPTPSTPAPQKTLQQQEPQAQEVKQKEPQP